MACTTSAPASGATPLLPGDRLDEIENTLFHLHHLCSLIGHMAGTGQRHAFTDGLPVEMFAVVFGWLGDELHDLHLHVTEIQSAFLKESQSC